MHLLTKVIPSREYYAISKDFNLKQAWKNEWVRDNVLKPVFEELESKDYKEYNKALQFGIDKGVIGTKFNINNLRRYINRYGKTNKQIAEEVVKFVYTSELQDAKVNKDYNKYKPEFYAYYADYDWVVFCQLFGTMMDLPKGFPMYCKDLKQTLDEEIYNHDWNLLQDSRYPKQTNEHNALTDAKWNYELYKFIQTL